jgi:hypothetical protein
MDGASVAGAGVAGAGVAAVVEHAETTMAKAAIERRITRFIRVPSGLGVAESGLRRRFRR